MRKNICKFYLKFILSVFLLMPMVAQAQDDANIIAYFDKDWGRTEAENAYYFRTAKEMNDGRWLVKDYFMASLIVQMEATCTLIDPKLEFHGAVTYYHENGKVKREMVYRFNEPVGEEKLFYEDGRPQELILHKGKNSLQCQYWSESGQPLLIKGTGQITQKFLNGLVVFKDVVDSLVTAGYTISNDTKDTVFTMVPEPAEYKGGMMSLYKGLGSDLRYPALARKMGIQGKVFIEFVIDQKGKIEYTRVVRGIGGGCDDAAVSALIQQKKWKPARYKGKPVKQKMVIPVNFILG
jgi:TonB family protein